MKIKKHKINYYFRDELYYEELIIKDELVCMGCIKKYLYTVKICK